jgi:hypothetical protein
MSGISMFRHAPNTITVLEETDHTPYTPEEAAKRREKYLEELRIAEANAAFAEKEEERGFPHLHANAVVGLWGALESSLEDFLVAILMNEPELLRSEAFSKIRIPLAEYETLEKEERMRILVEELERGQGLGKLQGVGGLEKLLAYVDLSGDVEANTKKTLWEMQNIRNVIVHRGSVADKRLIQNCPWLGLKVGDAVVVRHDSLHKYDLALHDYLLTIIRRLGVKYDVDVESKMRAAASREAGEEAPS